MPAVLNKDNISNYINNLRIGGRGGVKGEIYKYFTPSPKKHDQITPLYLI